MAGRVDGIKGGTGRLAGDVSNLHFRLPVIAYGVSRVPESDDDIP